MTSNTTIASSTSSSSSTSCLEDDECDSSYYMKNKAQLCQKDDNNDENCKQKNLSKTPQTPKCPIIIRKRSPEFIQVKPITTTTTSIIGHTKMTSTVSTTSCFEDDDECDSSYFTKNKAQICREDDDNDESDENCKLKNRSKTSQTPQCPIIIRKRSPEFIRVKPITPISIRAPLHQNNRIAKIVDNLLQKRQPPPQQQEPQPVQPINYHLKMMQNLKKYGNEENMKRCDENDEDDDDLKSLNWLNTFSLASTGLVPLSPPLSPEQQQQQRPMTNVVVPVVRRQYNNVINEQQLRFMRSMRCGGDEADSAHHSVVMKARRFLGGGGGGGVYQFIKPPYTFSCLAFLAIETSDRKRLSVKDIYAWVIQCFPYYRNVPSGSWKNSIRHNLSANPCFTKVDKNLLAMRDFSGKGSLWCTNPTYRPTLVDALAKIATTTTINDENPYSSLSQLACLQDVHESAMPRVAAVQGFRSRSASNLIYNAASPKPTLNPRLAARFISSTGSNLPFRLEIGGKSQPKITNTSKSSLNLLHSMSTSNHYLQAHNQQNDNYNEMDAVKALLSMKSRSSSMPLSASQSAAEAGTSRSFECCDESGGGGDLMMGQRKGRRKQLFKTPIKKPIAEEENVSQDGLSSPKSLDLHEEDGEEEENEVDDDPEFLSRSCKKMKTCFSSQRKQHQQQQYCMQSKKSRKLLVKFTSFQKSVKSKSANKLVAPETPESNAIDVDDEDDDDEEERNWSDELDLDVEEEEERDEDEEMCLKIDESANSDVESNVSKEAKKCNKNDESQVLDEESSSNPLLELSRAAYLVEERK